MDHLRATVGPSRPASRQKLWRGAAAAVGVVIGVLARELPVGLALIVAPGTPPPECPTSGVLDCLITDAGLAFTQALKVGFVALVLSGCLVLAALACFIVGWLRRSRESSGAPGGKTDWRALRWIGLGSALLVTGGWLPAQLIVFLVR